MSNQQKQKSGTGPLATSPFVDRRRKLTKKLETTRRERIKKEDESGSARKDMYKKRTDGGTKKDDSVDLKTLIRNTMTLMEADDKPNPIKRARGGLAGRLAKRGYGKARKWP